MKKQKIKRYLKLISLGLGGTVIVVGTLVAVAAIFFERLGYDKIILTNDTADTYEVTPILVSHDNGKIYRGNPVTIEPDAIHGIKGGFDRFVCLEIKEIGITNFDTYNLPDETSKNLFGGDVEKYYGNVSTLITNANKNDCLYAEYIGKVAGKVAPKNYISSPGDPEKVWRMYFSDEGYSIRHRIYWETSQGDTSLGRGTLFSAKEINNSDDRRGLSVVVTDLSLEELIKRFEATDPSYQGPILAQIVEREDFVLDGIQGTKLTGSTEDGSGRNFIFVRKDDKSYIIIFNDYNDTHLKMVDTFKFTK